jgi:hypothetical protein
MKEQTKAENLYLLSRIHFSLFIFALLRVSVSLWQNFGIVSK